MQSALHQLLGGIEWALEANEYTLGVFFDIEGAFDNTTCKSVRHAMACTICLLVKIMLNKQSAITTLQ